MERRDPYRFDYGRAQAGLVPGLILVALGALFFLNNLQIVYFREWIRYWPAILIAFGIVKLVDSTQSHGRVWGAILVGVGGILIMRALGLVSFAIRDMWPLILVGVGLLLLFQRGFGWPPPDDAVVTAGTLNESAVFGGGKRNIATHDFRGGQVSAVFGGFELDLRKAQMPDSSAVLEIHALFGGVEMRVPESWSVELAGTGVFGGWSDETTQPHPETPGYKRFIVKGSAVFGGVVVKN